MKSLLMFGLLSFYASGWAMAQTPSAETGQMTENAVTLEELQGAFAEGQIVHHKIIRQKGREYKSLLAVVSG